MNVLESEITKVLLNLNVNKASGPDGIGNKILKNIAYSISRPLSMILNKSLQLGRFPEQWKLANVVPIYKKNDRSVASNYRPVSLLSNLSKVFERLVFNKLYEYFDTQNLLTERNSGFKKQDSTINQIIHITQRIYNALDDHKDVCMIFLDISKAFDKVYHEGLLFKLRQLGIEGIY